MNSALLAATAAGVEVGAAMAASEVVVAQVGAGTLGFLRYLIGANGNIGLARAFLATVIGAICSAFYRPYVSRYGVLLTGFIAMAASLMPLGIMSVFEARQGQIALWTPDVWLPTAFVGLSSGIGYLLWLYALLKAPAGIVTAFLALSPITSVLLSVVILNGDFPGSLFLVLCFIVPGLVVLFIRSKDDLAAESKTDLQERLLNVN